MRTAIHCPGNFNFLCIVYRFNFYILLSDKYCQMLILNSKKYDIMITNKLITTIYNNEILIR